MTTSQQWQLAQDTAARYEQILVPAILGPFARALVEWSNLQPGVMVLDVGCGTGAATRAAAATIGRTGRVVGLDNNLGMLTVAQTLPAVAGAVIEWHEGSAYALPFLHETVDVVLCAQVLQFLADPSLALAEIQRVLKPQGWLTLSLWCDLAENPYFYALVAAVAHHISRDTAAGLGAAFKLSEPATVHALLTTANFCVVDTTSLHLTLQLPPLSEFIPRHVSATPMAAGFQAAPVATQQAIVQDVVAQLQPFVRNGTWRIPFHAYAIRSAKTATYTSL